MGKKKSSSFIGNNKQAANLSKRDIQHHTDLNALSEPDRPVGIYTTTKFLASARAPTPAPIDDKNDAALLPG
jgi:hypothetical protein